MNILMVCLGNICRSPIAEGVLKHKAGFHQLDWYIDSAGIESYHIGERPHKLSQNICHIKGIDISGQRARLVKASDFHRFDIIYAMATDVQEALLRIAPHEKGREKVKLFLEELYPGKSVSVPDPYYGPKDGFSEVFDLVEANCNAIIEKFINSPVG